MDCGKDWDEVSSRARAGFPDELREGLRAGCAGALAAFVQAFSPNGQDPRTSRDSDWTFALLQEDLVAEQDWARAFFLGALGDRAPWARRAFHAWYQPMIERICRGFIKDAGDARDLAMDVAMLFVERYTTNAIPTFPGYLVRMTRTLALRKASRAGRVVPVGLSPEPGTVAEGSVDAQMIADETRAALRGCLARLTVEQRALLVLRFYRTMTLKEIGAQQGRSHQAVAQEIGRLLAKISVCMKRCVCYSPGGAR